MQTKTPPTPWWVSMTNVFVGMIFIAFALTIVGAINLDFVVHISILVAAIITIGLVRILNGFFVKKSRTSIRLLKITIGSLLVPLGIITISMPNLGDYDKIVLIASGLIANSLLRIIIGFYDLGIEFWIKMILIVIGTITLVISVLVLVFPGWGVNTFMILLAISLLLNGITRIFYAIRTLGMEH